MEELDPRKSTPMAFVPSPLIAEGRPELAVFPLNILFMTFANIDGVDTSGKAIYWPDLETYQQELSESRMRYLNQYGPQDYIDLRHSVETGRYEGDKYVRGENVSSTFGASWKMFFVHLTMSGLSKGEHCLFEPMK